MNIPSIPLATWNYEISTLPVYCGKKTVREYYATLDKLYMIMSNYPLTDEIREEYPMYVRRVSNGKVRKAKFVRNKKYGVARRSFRGRRACNS